MQRRVGVKVLEPTFLICEEVGFMHEIDAFPLHSICGVGTAFPRSKRRCFLSFSVQTMIPASIVNEKSRFDWLLH